MSLVGESAHATDALVKPANMREMALEITMALGKDSRLIQDLQELLHATSPEPVTGGELDQIAREAIPRAAKKEASKYSNAHTLTLLIVTSGSLSCEEMASLTEHWKKCFHAICLLRLIDFVIVWPRLKVLSGTEPF